MGEAIECTCVIAQRRQIQNDSLDSVAHTCRCEEHFAAFCGCMKKDLWQWKYGHLGWSEAWQTESCGNRRIYSAEGAGAAGKPGLSKLGGGWRAGDDSNQGLDGRNWGMGC